MTKVFANGDFKQFKAAVENKKAVLIICKTDKTSFGLFFVDPIIFGQWNSSSLICAFNIAQRKEFKGKGKVGGKDGGERGWVQIGYGEVGIRVNGKGDYETRSNSGKEILQITEDENGINAINQEEGNADAYFDKLEVYA